MVAVREIQVMRRGDSSPPSRNAALLDARGRRGSLQNAEPQRVASEIVKRNLAEWRGVARVRGCELGYDNENGRDGACQAMGVRFHHHFGFAQRFMSWFAQRFTHRFAHAIYQAL